LTLASVALILAHVACGLSAQSASVRILALAGSLAALGLDMARGHPSAVAIWNAFNRVLRGPWLVLLAGPVALEWLSPTVAFARLDGRYAILALWLGLICVALAEAGSTNPIGGRAGRPQRPIPWLTAAFVCVAGLLWLVAVCDAGMITAALKQDRNDRFTQFFGVWTRTPASRHWFLAFFNQAYLDGRSVYTNHLPPYLFSTYAAARALSVIEGVPLWGGVQLLPVVKMLVGIAGFAALTACWRGRVERVLPFYASLFVGVGLVVSEPHYWTSLSLYNVDNVFPLVVFLSLPVFATASPSFRIARKGGTLSLAIYSAYAWIYTPLMLAALWCAFSRRAATVSGWMRRNRPLAVTSATSVAVFAIAYSWPRALVWWRGDTGTSSEFLFRSGLDGDTRYFHDIVQAVFVPICCNERPGWTMIFPGLTLLLVAAAASWQDPKDRRTLGRLFLFVSAPYWFSLALAPQAVSIHPYMYDLFLFVPATIVGAAGMLLPSVQRRLRGFGALGFLLLAGMLLSAHFTSLAQVARRPSAL
jgi:hypothetical protein